jgi:hypothetical protein
MINTENDKPTELSLEDINKFVESLMNSEIKIHECRKCSKSYIHDSYGHHIGECDECWFSRFPKEQVKEFYMSFFE